jgi:hypothetical protein
MAEPVHLQAFERLAGIAGNRGFARDDHMIGRRCLFTPRAGVDEDNNGHHHLLIDTGLPSLDKPIPSDDRHRHFGGVQTEAVIELAPGKHTWQLLFAEFTHTPHSPPVVSEQITVTLE